MKRTVLLTSLLLGFGVIASTVVALLAADSGWWVLVAPLVMGLAMLGVGAIGDRAVATPRGGVRLAWMMSASLLVASALVAAADPAHVATIMPVLSASTAYPLVARLRNDYRKGACARRPAHG